jgi:DNA-directed RNA polymerase specialized sigma24 family protein
MRKNSEITPKDFNGLLARLSPDAEEAGEKYEQIRKGLIKYFYYRGALDPESLTDETINRVAAKLPEAPRDEKFVLANYFYSFAANIFLEDYRKRKKIVAVDDDYLEMLKTKGEALEENGFEGACMKKCLAGRAPEESELLLKYYGFEKGDRNVRRKMLAAQQGISIELLHTKVSRLRKALRDCLKKCLNGE